MRHRTCTRPNTIVTVISESILSRIAIYISSLHHMICFPGVSQGVVSSFRDCIHTNTTPRSSYSESPGRYSLRWKFSDESVESSVYLGVHYNMSYTARDDELTLRSPGQVSILNNSLEGGVKVPSTLVRIGFVIPCFPTA